MSILWKILVSTRNTGESNVIGIVSLRDSARLNRATVGRTSGCVVCDTIAESGTLQVVPVVVRIVKSGSAPTIR